MPQGAAPTPTVQVGLGIRSWLFSAALAGPYRKSAELVGLCDLNAGRLDHRLAWARGAGFDPKACDPGGFDDLVRATGARQVIVTTPDRDHDPYICRAMELGCDVVSEKPLTIDAPRCQRILDTAARTGRACRVTFNYRYSPPRAQVKELLAGGAIGDVVSVDFQWLLDTWHGADYFRRWHRRKESSGGLLVHKATHHFDLVNWWLGSVPETVHATGRTAYYTPAQAERLGLAGRGERCLGCAAAPRCPFHLDLEARKELEAIYLRHEHHDGYHRDRCVFSPEIDAEDTAGALVTYRSGAQLVYSLHAFMPYEGYRVAFNGTKGRLEHTCRESSYLSGDGTTPGVLQREQTGIEIFPHFGPKRRVRMRRARGGHGGGDQKLLADLFAARPGPDPLGRAADHRAGAWAALVGIAANRSIATGETVRIGDLVTGLDEPGPWTGL